MLGPALFRHLIFGFPGLQLRGHLHGDNCAIFLQRLLLQPHDLHQRDIIFCGAFHHSGQPEDMRSAAGDCAKVPAHQPDRANHSEVLLSHQKREGVVPALLMRDDIRGNRLRSCGFAAGFALQARVGAQGSHRAAEYFAFYPGARCYQSCGRAVRCQLFRGSFRKLRAAAVLIASKIPRSNSLPVVHYQTSLHNAQLQSSCRIFSNQNKFLTNQLLLQSKQKFSNDAQRREKLLQQQVIAQMTQIKKLQKQISDDHNDYYVQQQKSLQDSKVNTLENQLLKFRKANEKYTERITQLNKKIEKLEQTLSDKNSEIQQQQQEIITLTRDSKDKAKEQDAQLDAKDKHAREVEEMFRESQQKLSDCTIQNSRLSEQLALAEGYQNEQEEEFLHHFKQSQQVMATDQLTDKLTLILKCNSTQILQLVQNLKTLVDKQKLQIDKYKSEKSKRHPNSDTECQQTVVIKQQETVKKDTDVELFGDGSQSYEDVTCKSPQKTFVTNPGQEIFKSTDEKKQYPYQQNPVIDILLFDMNTQTELIKDDQAEDYQDIILLLKEYFCTTDEYQLPVKARKLTLELGRYKQVTDDLYQKQLRLQEDYRDLMQQLQQKEKYYTRNDVRIFLYKLLSSKIPSDLKHELELILRSLE